MTVFAFYNIGLYFNDSTSVLSCFCNSYFMVNSILRPCVMVAKLVKYFVSGKNVKFLVQKVLFGEDVLRANIALISLFHIDFCLFVIKFFCTQG